MTRIESNELIISMAKKCSTYFTINEIKEHLAKDGHSFNEQQIRNKMNLTKFFEFDKITKMYRMKISKINNKIIKANEMKAISEQYFLDKANEKVENILIECIKRAKNGESLFTFNVSDEPRVVEIIKKRLLDLEYQIADAGNEIVIKWF